MSAPRVFVSFDFDHDEDLRNLLIGQARHPGSPFEVTDYSVREPETGDWEGKIRARMRRVSQVAVICGRHTDTATGVAAEVRIAREEALPYFLLAGRADGGNVRPVSALQGDKMYRWTWENLKRLIDSAR